jgi:UDP-N-acetylglucosamine--N-acetylmuramyl-(pentapeptide) pyrophosphoryl-undecaprenol N-acetylglucosamine transferase
MRIVFTGGGTGGHFYPHIAVAEYIEDIVTEKRLVEPELFYVGPKPFDPPTLQEHDIEYRPSPAGKLRQYSSPLNIFDGFKTAWGVIQSLFQLFSIFPDVIFSTGGYAAFPTLYAAKILRIPVVIYDADATPGKVSLWSAKFARWIGVAHPNAAAAFPEKYRHKTALLGHPIRKEIETLAAEGGHEFLNLDPSVPTIFVVGGSQGARVINECILDALPDLVQKYNVVHQTGTANLQEVRGIASVSLKNNQYEKRYVTFGLLNTLAIRMAAGIATLMVARAGSGTIFELAVWKLPSILVPLPIDISHDQTENAFSYARSGAASVIEQHNLSPHILIAEVDRIMQSKEIQSRMSEAAGEYARPEAAKKIAQILIETALEHEPK